VVDLVQGERYLMAVKSESDYPLRDVEIDIQPLPAVPGGACSSAIDLSGASFPHRSYGLFEADTSQAASCRDERANGVFYRYTPAATGWYRIRFRNQTGVSPARTYLTAYETAACTPNGPEIACQAVGQPLLETTLYLTGGVEVQLAFHTDGDAVPMVDPEVSIVPWYPDPGQVCSQPADVTGATAPVLLSGLFTDQRWDLSCTYRAQGIAWFSFTPPGTDTYRIHATNHAPQVSESGLAVFETLACSPPGGEQICRTSLGRSATTTLVLQGGTPYLVAFFTGYDDMLDPELGVEAVTLPPGSLCESAVDVSGATFPVSLPGDFTVEPSAGSTCDPMPHNAAWARYTAPVSDWYRFTAANPSPATSRLRLAVFAPSACELLAPQLDCAVSDTSSASAVAHVTAGQEVLLLASTQSDGITMVDPTFDVAPTPPPPSGLKCNRPAQVGDPNHQVSGQGADCWSWAADPNDTAPHHSFSCDGYVSGDVVVAYTTGPSQHQLQYEATLPNAPPYDGLALEISEEPCAPPLARVHCESTDSVVISDTVSVAPSTTYYLWLAHSRLLARPALELCLQ
jgi:hypothetical protein